MGQANGELRSVPQGVNYRKGRLQFLDQSARSFVSLAIPDGTMEEKAGAFCVMDDYLFATLEYLDRTEVVRYDLSGMDLQ